MTEAEMKRGVLGYFEAVGSGDRAALTELFAKDLVWRVPQGAIEPYAGDHEGADAIIDLMLGAVDNAFVPGSQTTEIKHLLYGENIAVAETEMRAATSDGRQYRNCYTFFFEFRNGRISEIREHVDTAYAARFFAPPNT